MEDNDQPIADLIGHHIEISTRCKCQKVTVLSPGYAMQRMGDDVTLRIMAARLRCRVCRERPKLYLDLEWAYSGGRDDRVDPEPIPEWARRVMKRKG